MDIPDQTDHKPVPSEDNCQKQINQTKPIVPPIMCRSIPGGTSPYNAFSLDCHENLLSFGCQNVVVFCSLDENNVLSKYNTLQRHKYHVNRTCWQSSTSESIVADTTVPLQLASCDTKGTIIIWNAFELNLHTIIHSSIECLSKRIIDMQWVRYDKQHPSLNNKTTKFNYLLVLYASSVLVLYDTDLSDSVWYKNLHDPEVRGFSIDHFDCGHLLIDRNVVNLPEDSQQPTNSISSQSLETGANNIASNLSLPPINSSLDLRNGTFFVVNGLTNKKFPSNPMTSFELHYTINIKPELEHQQKKYSIKSKDMSTYTNAQPDLLGRNLETKILPSQRSMFDPSTKNQVILSLDKDILVINIEENCIKNVINIERNLGNVYDLYPCIHKGFMYTLHTSGTIVARIDRNLLDDQSRDINKEQQKNVAHIIQTYFTLCQSDNLRLTRQGKIYGFKILSKHETVALMLLSSGKLVVCQMMKSKDESRRFRLDAEPRQTLFELLDYKVIKKEVVNQIEDVLQAAKTNSQMKRRPSSNLGFIPTSTNPYKIAITQCMSFIEPKPTTLRMGPPATIKNWRFHKPLLAIGSSCGSVQIFNLVTGRLVRELNIHSCTVRGIEWVCLNSFITYAYTEQSGSGDQVSWELSITNIDSGRTVLLKSGRGFHEAIIQSVKVSHLRQYFIIVYHDLPFEVWDLDSLSMVRLVSRKFSHIVAAEWSPLYSKRIVPADEGDIKKSLQRNESEQNSEEKSSFEVEVVKEFAKEATLAHNSLNIPTSAAPLRENFVVINKFGDLYHFSIAGSVVKEVSKLRSESGLWGATTSVSWKSDHLVLGTSSGTMNVWDLRERQSRALPTARGAIRQIRFAPGRGNMKVLLHFDDGVDIWDVDQSRRLSSLKTKPANTAHSTYEDQSATLAEVGEHVEALDWASSDRPVILRADGIVLVTDVKFKQMGLSDTRTDHGTNASLPDESWAQPNSACAIS